MAFSSRFVQCLRLQQLPSHLDLQLLFDTMQLTPTQLSISYNPRGLGMNYSSNAAGMRLSDCRMLARALAHTETLVVLDLSNNSLNDDMARMLASGLADNISITHLNLSHNSISDRGVRALARLLDENSIVCTLDLSGNQLQADSGRALARAVSHSRALMSLNLRLNRLGDEGCKAICEALAHAGAAAVGTGAAAGHSSSGGGGSTGTGANAVSTPKVSGMGSNSSKSKGPCCLQQLNLSSNGAGVGVVPAVCSMLRACGSLQELDLSCNQLGDRLSTDLTSATATSAGLTAFDVRGCGVGVEAEGALQQLMLDRIAQKEAAKLFAWAGNSGPGH
jgi:Ran GTPase-activating protein (RanGAP) involved in mRNA processing and transport